MPSRTFKLIHQAILARRQLTFVYGGYYRETCPHILGHKAGRETVLAYQFGGESSRKLPRGGEWRCFSLAEMEKVEARDGPWHSGASHQTSQACVDVVYVDVNTDVPNQPGRS